MAGMKLTKTRVPIDYCHREDEVLGALDAFDTESGDLQCEGFVDAKDARADEISRKGKMGVPYEASIFFDRRTVEAERLSDRETATVNGVTVRGPVTIIRKWTLRGVAICPYGYDPKTSTRFSEETDSDVSVTLLSRDPQIGEEPMSTNSQPAGSGELSETVDTESQAPESQVPPGQLAGMFGRLLVRMAQLGRPGDESDEPSASKLGAGSGDEKPPEKPAEKTSELSGEVASVDPPKTSTELGTASGVEKPNEKTAPGQAFIDRFGLQQGAVYFAQGLSMDKATAEHNKALEKKVEELSARIEGANLGSEEPVSFSGEGGGAAGEQNKGSGDEALDTFCANTKLPGSRG
jgi:hypothetical protein